MVYFIALEIRVITS